jgi:hypothetical protein
MSRKRAKLKTIITDREYCLPAKSCLVMGKGMQMPVWL